MKIDAYTVQRVWSILACIVVVSWAMAVMSPAKGDPPTDVPLVLWTYPSFPDGVPMGKAHGVSFGDYDADGWIDVFIAESAELWNNVGGETWELAANLNSILPHADTRYGSSFADYNHDGRPDIAVEPRKRVRGDTCLHLLRNLGDGPHFVDIAIDPELMDGQPCGVNAETITWGDVDGDGDLDLFLPAYPPWEEFAPSNGNAFLRNMGPTGPNDTYRFEEYTTPGGFDNVLSTPRPEGAQFVDLDFDGDIDLYVSNTVYQNISAVGVPRVDAIPGATVGIHPPFESTAVVDEGAVFVDYDLDGDYDLLVGYEEVGQLRIWENYGDGTFFEVESELVKDRTAQIGFSAVDWDNDGDIDFNSAGNFQRNMLIETGRRSFTRATHMIPSQHSNQAILAWGDWDKDGDLDSVLAPYLGNGHFYENTTYDRSTPVARRRYVRIRPVRDSDHVPSGLETEYGASVEVRLVGDDSGYRRKNFTASSTGYLNQNEYTLHFGLPQDPSPEIPDEDLRFDVSVDFPNLPAEGLWRVDRHVNPALGNLNLADLTDREITVFRSGSVLLNGRSLPPQEFPVLTTAAGGLALSLATKPLRPPEEAPNAHHFVGLDFETHGTARDLHIREVILDGQLATEDAGMRLWDITDSSTPKLFAMLGGTTSTRNRRSYFPTDLLLEPEREYRLVVPVRSFRATAIQGPVASSSLTLHGGLRYSDTEPDAGVAAATAQLDPSQMYLTLRFKDLGDSSASLKMRHWLCQAIPEVCSVHVR